MRRTNNYIKLLIFAFLLALSFKAPAQECIDGIWYFFNGTEAVVTFRGQGWITYNEYSGTVEIPDTVTYNGIPYAVTSIRKEAFRGCFNLNKVVIGHNVTNIEEYTFYDCSNLHEIIFPETLKAIGYRAFQNTSFRPDTLYLPDSLNYYDMTAFPIKEHQVIYIPEKVTTIRNYTSKYEQNSYWQYTLYLNDNTVVIHSKAEEPPFVDDLTGTEYYYNRGTSFGGFTIYVPKGTKELYEATRPWSNATIIEETIVPQSIDVELEAITLIPNESIQLNASVSPENADTDIAWASSNNSVVTVDSSGVIIAKNKGIATIYASTTDGSNLIDSCIVTVIQPVEGLIMERHNLSLYIGDCEQLYANVMPVNADNKKLIWTTTDSEIAEVDADGNVTAKKCGIAFIKAISEDNPLAIDSCNVIVNQPVTGIMLNSQNCELYAIGETLQLVATVLPEDAFNKEVKWVSSDESVCIVSSGTVEAVGYGNCVIIATTVDGNFTATCTVKVVDGSFLPGDTDGDGKVSIADVVAIIDYLLGNTEGEFYEDAADVNGNGSINIADAVELIDILLAGGN